MQKVDKTELDIPDLSFLNLYEIILVDDVLTIRWANLKKKWQNTGNEYRYVVKSGDRLDLLSNEFYGTYDLWWIIALVNNIDGADLELSEMVGKTILIPRQTDVLDFISKNAE